MRRLECKPVEKTPRTHMNRETCNGELYLFYLAFGCNAHVEKDTPSTVSLSGS